MPTEKYIDLSTAHITEQDNAILTKIADGGADSAVVRFARHEYGYILFIPLVDSREMPERRRDEETKAKMLGLSTAYVGLIQHARNKKCQIVNIDRDGEAKGNLPTFEW